MKQIKFLFVTIAFLLFVSAIPENTTTIFITGDYTVDSKGRGQYLTIDDAIAAAQASAKDDATIQILGGEWDKPQLPKKSKIKFILRQNASWK